MVKRKIPKGSVIRDQKRVIEAQNTLIEWLLRQVEKRRPAAARSSETFEHLREVRTSEWGS